MRAIQDTMSAKSHSSCQIQADGLGNGRLPGEAGWLDSAALPCSSRLPFLAFSAICSLALELLGVPRHLAFSYQWPAAGQDLAILAAESQSHRAPTTPNASCGVF